MDLDSPQRSAIDLRDQCVALAGADSSVATTTSSTCSGLPTRAGPAVGRRPTRRSAPRRTGAATSRPSAAPPPPALRPPCSTGPRRSPARSATATPAPATTYAAASTASASRAPPRSTPAPPSAAHVMLYANHPTRQRDSPRNTASAHRLQLCNEFQAQDTRCALNPSAGRAVVASECALRPVRHMPSKLALAFESDEFPCRTTLFIE